MYNNGISSDNKRPSLRSDLSKVRSFRDFTNVIMMEVIFWMDLSNKCTVMLLGTYHMDNPGLDMFNVTSDNVLTPKRQVEIQEVVDRLKMFNPTKIAVEALVDQHAVLNQQYLSYLAGDYSLSS